MALDFPSSPQLNAVYTSNGRSWIWDGTAWNLDSNSGLLIQDTAPASTSILWADTSEVGNPVIPTGGTTAQSLVKKTATNYDVQWKSVWEDDQTVLASQVFG